MRKSTAHCVANRLRAKAALILFALCGCPFLRSQATTVSVVSRDIGAIRNDDDTDHPSQNTPEAVSEYEQRGRTRSREVRNLLSAGRLTTPEDLYKAAFILQHSETKEDYLLAHVLAVDSLAKGDSEAKWLSAATLDRYLQLAGQPQIFGTQYPLDPKKAHPVNVEHHARYLGRTQEPYDRKLLPEGVRTDFCVPSTGQQEINLQTLESDRYPTGTMVAPGCKR